MKDTDDKWLKSLEKRVNHYSKPLPEGDWEDFASKAFAPKEQKSKRLPLYRNSFRKWVQVAAILIAVLIPSAVAWLYFGRQDIADQTVAVLNNKGVSRDKPIGAVADSADVKSQSVLPVMTAHVVAVSHDKLARKETESAPTHNESSEIQNFGGNENNIAKNEIQPEQDTVEVVPLPSSSVIVGTELASVLPKSKSHKSSGRIFGGTLGATATGVLASYLLSMNSGSEYNNESNDLQANVNSILYTSFIRIPVEVTPRKLDYAFSAAVSLREPLTNNLSLDQNLFFQFGNWKNDIGLSLKLTWEIWQNSRWMVYASAGPSYQLHLIDDVFKHKGLVSLQLSPGIQFNISRNFGIYAEPNVNWFLNTDNHVQYGSHRLLPGTQTGLRYSF